MEELGRGGMGLVFKAIDRRTDAVVALKCLPPASLSDPVARARLGRERDVLGALDSPRIVRLLTSETIDGLEVLVLEYIPGRTLAAVVRDDGPLPARQACRVLADVVRGLLAAHARGVVHRDIKPSNLMRTPEGDTRILDFGVAALVEADAAEALTRPGVGLGTMDYMPPEQIAAAYRATPASDWYSFGCVAHFLLTGSPPFGDRPTEVGKIFAHKMVPPPDLDRATVPDALADLVRALLAKEPGDRPGGEEILRALESVGAESPAARIPRSRPKISRRERVSFSLLLMVGLAAGVALHVPTWTGEPMSTQLASLKLVLEIVVVACGAIVAMAALLGRVYRLRWASRGVVATGFVAVTVAAVFWAGPSFPDRAGPPGQGPPDFRHPWTVAAGYLGTAPEAEKEGCRFVSFGVPGDEDREPWREAVEDWVRQSFPDSAVEPLDPRGTVLLVRLRPADRTVKEVWGELVAGDPYAVKSDAADEAALREAFRLVSRATRTSHPMVRGDWLLSVVAPGHALVERYREPLDLPRAAAELGVPADLLAARLSDDPALSPLGLQGLARGRTVPRDLWAGRRADGTTPFQALASRFGLGYPLTP